jgi:hypothetical protein
MPTSAAPEVRERGDRLRRGYRKCLQPPICHHFLDADRIEEHEIEIVSDKVVEGIETDLIFDLGGV